MFTLRQYLTALDDPYGLLRTLGDAEVCRDPDGRPLYSTGNSAAVFRIRHQGRIRSLRCYFRPTRHLSQIYGKGFLPGEVYVHITPDTGIWADAVVSDWIEGETLHQAVTRAAQAHDRSLLATLSKAFDRLAATLVADDSAHGDLKPENLILTPDGTLRPIDLDASFLPAFAGQSSPELGTAAYQHPARTPADFDASLDDFPAALISTALSALAADPTLYDRYGNSDGLLFPPRTIRTSPAFREALALFESDGAAVRYRIAKLLLSPTLRLAGLQELLAQTISDGDDPAKENNTPELFVENGLWGYRTPERVVIPPLYDCGFDFTEGLAAVCLGQTWHFIDTAGRTAIRCGAYDAVKPFRGGRAQVIRDGRKYEIDPLGREFDI